MFNLEKRNDTLNEHYWDKNEMSTFEFSTEYKNRINNKNYIKLGFNYFNTHVSFIDSVYIKEVNIYVHTKDVDGRVPVKG